MGIATRGGRDSYCNASSALDVLGAMVDYARIPQSYKPELDEIRDTRFSFIDSSNDIVKSAEARALAVIKQAGGQVSDSGLGAR